MPILRRSAEVGRVAAGMLAGPERRYVLRWLASLRRDWLLRQQEPWLTFGATEQLRRALAGWDQPRVFEFGSGGSTLFWLRHRAAVVSVEHDPGWHARLLRELPTGAELDYRLVPPAPGAVSRDPADPDGFASDDPSFAGMSFEAYARQIEEFPDHWFDIVLVDGRARPACLSRAVAKVKPGGLLVLDNAERSYYVQRVVGLESFVHRVHAGHHPGLTTPGRTDIYLKR